ncbi:MAG: hypothetical protein ACW98F_19040, partial [Candidatus Hodarchaeales archaeon]|jgi:hypothetical protein
VLPWNLSRKLRDSNIKLDYTADVLTLTNTSGETLRVSIPDASDFIFSYNQTSTSYEFKDRRASKQENMTSIFANATYPRYRVEQNFVYSYGFFIRNSVFYRQIFVFDSSYHLHYGFVLFGWGTT